MKGDRWAGGGIARYLGRYGYNFCFSCCVVILSLALCQLNWQTDLNEQVWAESHVFSFFISLKKGFYLFRDREREGERKR